MDPLWLLALGMLVVVGAIVGLRLHAFLALLLAAVVVDAFTPRSSLETYAQAQQLSPDETSELLNTPLGKRIASGFGRTCGNIGILIALAAIIGKCLLESGAAERIVRSAMRMVGETRAPIAFLGSGFLLSIPVFFDTVFFLLIPLAKALRLRTGRNYLLYIMTIIAGGTMAHSLVPPTPGPLFVADRLGVNIGHMMIGGTILGLFTACIGFIYATWLNKRLDVPLRDSTDAPLTEFAAITNRNDRELPSLTFSLAPILIPVLLIAGDAILKLTLSPEPASTSGALLRFTRIAGEPNLALGLGALLALLLLVRTPHDTSRPLAASLQDALANGGLVILITAAGGAFGAILQQTGVSQRIESLATTYQIGLLPLAFFVTTLVRTAQGSATVAMITAVGILTGLLQNGQLPFHPVYLALAIGCGSKPFPWMNDSGFWVISKMSGLTIPETFKAFSFMVTIMSLVGLVLIMIAARIFPLVS